jgi:putative membrane protein
MGAFTPEMASHLHGLLQNILDASGQCGICVSQREPSSYIVHTRTFVYLWCFTFPWTLIGTVTPASLIPTQFAISYALLGIEFCAREMDYPFGDDEGDVPVRLILAGVREEISRSHGKHYRPQPEAELTPSAQGG